MRWDLTCTAEMRAQVDRIWSVAWSPDGGLLASTGVEKIIRIWQKDLWSCLYQLNNDVHSRTIRHVEWSPDGSKLAAAGFDSLTSVWEMNGENEWTCVNKIEGHENEVKCVAWHASGRLLVTCGRDKTIQIWEYDEDISEISCASVLCGHSQDVKQVKWHPNMEWLFSCSYDNTIKIWTKTDEDWECTSTLTGHLSTVWSLAFDKTGDNVASVSDDRTLRIWRLRPEKKEISLLHSYYLFGMFKQQSQPTEKSSSFPVYECICVIDGIHERPIYSVDWESSSDLIATACGDNNLRLFSRSENNGDEEWTMMAQTIGAHDADVNCVKWRPNNLCDSLQLATAGDDGYVKIWQLSCLEI
eukprot:GHVL01043066.1.p1 GENE.GHVL01043066.1~~GHVL01043066.1.p1  ORF type:complete len:357 (+),score=51.36 GHVL01043066.1:1997-3067(+)